MIDLIHDADSWSGAFHLLCATAVEDLLSDGAPIPDARIETGDGATLTGEITAIAAAGSSPRLITINAAAVDIDDIRRLQFA